MPSQPVGRPANNARDPRRNLPRMDELLRLYAVESARETIAEHAIRATLTGVLAAARRGDVPVAGVEQEIARRLARHSTHSLHPVINATGVIIHTNLGRAPLPAAAIDALQDAAGYTDVEMDFRYRAALISAWCRCHPGAIGGVPRRGRCAGGQ